MQYKCNKSDELAKAIGQVIRESRLSKKNCSINQFAHEYDLDVGNTSRVENGHTDIKVVTLWKIAEALELKPSSLLKLVEKSLGESFHFYDY